MVSERTASITRETGESRVEVHLCLDVTGHFEIHTGICMLDHLLAALARHSLMDMTVTAHGDYEVDEHHTAEDVALVLGRALNEALGERKGIARMGHAIVPMDEALALVAVDLGGRPYAVVEASFSGHKIGSLPADLVRHMLETLALEARMNLHARLLSGTNDHHRAEALFKALARALGAASRLDPRVGKASPSTKGTIDV